MTKPKALKVDLKLKTGEVIPAGTPVELTFDPVTNRALLGVEGREKKVNLPCAALHKYGPGCSKVPSLARLEKMSSDAICTTPTGYKVECDGHGPDGSPAWMLALNYI